MKTQIITLETHDDLISVWDRMAWAKAPRILLVWPKFEKVSLRPADLKVLQHHAQTLGADLGLVTLRHDIRRDAESFGLPVFDTTAQAQRNAWPVSPHVPHYESRRPRPDLRAMQQQTRIKESSWRSNAAVRIAAFALGVAAVLAVAALFFPRARVMIVPESQVQSVTVPISAGLDIPSVLLTGNVPAHQTTVQVEESQTITITSQGSVPQDKAEGVARFKNLTQSDLTIPAGTVVYTTGSPVIRFQTSITTHLPAGPTHFVEVPIIAVEAGSSGNVPADAIQAIEGSLSLSCAVTNPDPTTGGTDLNATAAADADRQRLHNMLMARIDQTARQQLAASIGPEDLLLANTVQAGQPLQEIYDPPAGQPGRSLKLTVQVQYTAQYVAAQDLTQLSQTVLDGSLPAGFVSEPHTLTYVALGKPVVDDSGISHFTLQGGRIIVRQIEPWEVIELVRGLSPAAARRALQGNLPLAQPALVEMQPSWWPWLPLVPFGITVQEQALP